MGPLGYMDTWGIMKKYKAVEMYGIVSTFILNAYFFKEKIMLDNG